MNVVEALDSDPVQENVQGRYVVSFQVWVVEPLRCEQIRFQHIQQTFTANADGAVERSGAGAPSSSPEDAGEI